MTRKRAIEEAIKANKMPPIAGASRTPTYDTFGIAEKAYEAGRIAGLREAARLIQQGNAPVSVNMRPDTYAWQKAQDVRKHARELAKKARGK